METVLLILRWAVALFLFRLAVLLPLGFWKRREPGETDWLFLMAGVILAAITGAIGFGLITWDWQPLWLAARCAVALIFAILAIYVVHALYKSGAQTLVFKLLFFCLGCAFVMPAISLVLLDWRWLLAAGSFLVLTSTLMIPGWLTKQKQETAGHWEMWAKSRGSPLTPGEAQQRLALGETVAPPAAPAVRSGEPDEVLREE